MASERLMISSVIFLLCANAAAHSAIHNYADALTKSILFFEGQRSGKLPPSQRLKWRKDSALRDGSDHGMDLTGGYYDAGDNVKFNFPMAFTATMLAWGLQEYGRFMGRDFPHAVEAIRWATDYFLKSTATPGVVYAQVGEPYGDHNCWQRPEDMDTPRNSYAITATAPGSEVSAEMAAAMAAGSLVFRTVGDENYADVLLRRAVQVFAFADKYRGSYNDSIGKASCPFYCDYNGYEDELLWGAAWLLIATKNYSVYWNYILQNMESFKSRFLSNLNQFSWDAKNAGVNVLLSQFVLEHGFERSTPFLSYADSFVCSILPESPTRDQPLSPGGLIANPGGCNMQTVASHSFLLITHAITLRRSKRVVGCNNVVIPPVRLIYFAKSQADYILGSNPMNMSYMVGYGDKFPQKIHHRGSTLPSIDVHPRHIACHDGSAYFFSSRPNPNMLVGAVVGGPGIDDKYEDDRSNPGETEPTTYVNAPLVGVFAVLKALAHQ